MYITTSVSDLRPFVGEQVSYVVKFHRRVSIGDARLVTDDPVGVEVHELAGVRDYQQTVNGQRYVVSEIRRALFPTAAGEVVLPAPEIVVEVREKGNQRGLFLLVFFGSK